MVEEGKAKLRVAADAHESVVGRHGRFFDRIGTEIGEFPVLQVSPDLFDGIEVVSIRGQPLGDELVALGLEELIHRAAAVRGQSVPNEGGLVTFEQFTQLGDELHEGLVVERAHSHGEHQHRVGPVAQSRERSPLRAASS